jgi:DNA-binding transcriptional ArsR family regulator
VGTYLEVGLEALSDATRMAIFQSLAKGPLAVNEIAQAFPVSRPAVSQHLRVLKDAGLVVHKKSGTRQIYEVNAAGIEVLRAHLDQMWDQALSAFKSAAQPKQEKSADSRAGRKPRRSQTSSG